MIMTVLCILALLAGAASAAEIRVGIVGLDTSHAPAFTRILNDKSDPDHVPGAKVVASFRRAAPISPPAEIGWANTRLNCATNSAWKSSPIFQLSAQKSTPSC